MSICQTLVSGKGGTGKTVLCALLGTAFAAAGEKVLLIDGDLGLRSLDLALGADNSVLNHLVDVVERRCSLSDAILPVKDCSGVSFLPAPQTLGPEALDPDKFRAFMEEIKVSFDRILIDSPPGIGLGMRNAAAVVDSALIVTTGSRSAVRGADRALGVLETLGIHENVLILNRINPEHAASPVEIAELIGIPVYGVIPEDRSIAEAAESGIPRLSENSPAAVCIRHTAERLRGSNIPLEDIKSMRKRRIVSFLHRD